MEEARFRSHPTDTLMPDPVPQAGVIPVRDGLVCLVTSRSRKRRWVIPKGRIERGQTPPDAAVAEAWEEAGLVGTVRSVPIGSFRYTKFDRPHLVTVYVLDVSEVHDDWPEQSERAREWVPVEVAVGRVDEPGLRTLLLAVAAEFPITPAAAG